MLCDLNQFQIRPQKSNMNRFTQVSRSRLPQFLMIILQLFWLIGSLSASPQYFNGFRGYGGLGGYVAPLAPLTVDIGTEVQRLMASPLASDPRITSQLDPRSPVTAAAYAYVQNLPGNNDICGKVTGEN